MWERKKAALYSEQKPVQMEAMKLQQNGDVAQSKAIQLMQQRADESMVHQRMERLQDLSQKRPSEKVLQAKANQTGLPDQLKSGIENLSGMAMDDVKVHYNSPKPAQLQAHAYAQGSDIHLASGQEKHLAHEAWHVVQQKQGRVQPTAQLKAKVAVNDNPQLENEATQMGNKAMQSGSNQKSATAQLQKRNVGRRGTPITQLVKKVLTHQEKIDALNLKIKKANDEIEKIHKIKDALKTDSSFTPMNPSVYLGEMQTTSNLSIDRDHSQLSSFSMLTMEHVNSLTKGKQTPEIQTSHVSTKLGDSIHLSGNTKKGNDKLRMKGTPTLSDFYVSKIRPVSVGKRSDSIRSTIKKDFKSMGSRKNFIQKLKVPKLILDNPPKDAKEFTPFMVKAILRHNKRGDGRIVAKSARRFAKNYGSRPIKIPENKKNLHAESAILLSMESVKGTIQQIGGTKVACLACMSFFEHKGQRNLLGDVTGYGWISKCSQDQLKELISTIDSAESYLIAVYGQLKSQISSLKRYTGDGGDKKVSHLTVEPDNDETDSEDEDAVKEIGFNEVQTIAEEGFKYFFPKK